MAVVEVTYDENELAIPISSEVSGLHFSLVPARRDRVIERPQTVVRPENIND